MCNSVLPIILNKRRDYKNAWLVSASVSWLSYCVVWLLNLMMYLPVDIQGGKIKQDKRDVNVGTRKDKTLAIELQANQRRSLLHLSEIDTPICKWCYLVIVREHFHLFFLPYICSVLCPAPFRGSLKRWNVMGKNVTGHNGIITLNVWRKAVLVFFGAHIFLEKGRAMWALFLYRF